MTASSLDRKIVVALERLAQALQRTLWDAAWQHDLSSTQAQVLLHLLVAGKDATSIAALAQRFDLKHSTLSDAVRALTAKGLVERQPDPVDARSVHLRLSRLGRATARRLQSWAQAVQVEVSRLPQDRQAFFLDTLLQLIGRLQRVGLISMTRMCSTCLYFQPHVHQDANAPHHCRLLNQPLPLVELRVDCPDHQPAAAETVREPGK